MSGMAPYFSLIGRILLSLIFIMSGFNKITNWSGTAAYMQSEGMFAVPFFLFLAIVFELVGGLMVLLGFKTRIGAILLVLFLIPTTFIFHDFWTYEGQEMQMQMIHFMKNLSIMGGLLVTASFGGGPLSLRDE